MELVGQFLLLLAETFQIGLLLPIQTIERSIQKIARQPAGVLVEPLLAVEQLAGFIEQPSAIVPTRELLEQILERSYNGLLMSLCCLQGGTQSAGG